MEEKSKDIPVVCHTQDQTRNTMKEPLVNSCCCCGSLRTGCLIIAWLKYIAIAIFIISRAVKINDVVSVLSNDSNNDYSTGAIIDAVWITERVPTLLIILNVLMTTVLMIGIHKDKQSYLHSFVIWIILEASWSVVDLILVMLGTGRNWFYLIYLIDLILAVYYALVVESYRRQLLNKEGFPPYIRLQNETPPKYEA